MHSEDDEEALTLGDLPDDPLAMPPPYWRAAATVLHVVDALVDLVRLLHELIPTVQKTEGALDAFYEGGADNRDHEHEEFGEICNDLWSLEYQIKQKVEIAVLMAAIQAEDKINCFCVFNLHKDIAESIEKLSPPEKLLVASASVGARDAKGSAAFEAVRKLTGWRNAFAHGHCTDRPTKSLRHNHLIAPPQYPSVPDQIEKLIELLNGYLKLADYLRAVSLNPYTRSVALDNEDVKSHLAEVKGFSFTPRSPDSNIWYSVEHGDAKRP